MSKTTNKLFAEIRDRAVRLVLDNHGGHRSLRQAFVSPGACPSPSGTSRQPKPKKNTTRLWKPILCPRNLTTISPDSESWPDAALTSSQTSHPL